MAYDSENGVLETLNLSELVENNNLETITILHENIINFHHSLFTGFKSSTLTETDLISIYRSVSNEQFRSYEILHSVQSEMKNPRSTSATKMASWLLKETGQWKTVPKIPLYTVFY